MKYLITLSISFFSIISCQKKVQLENIKSFEPLKNYLNIKVDNDVSLSIGELASVNDNINEDFQIINKKDSIFILKQFLESDNFDGKNLKIQSNHKLDINIKYNVGFNFLGDEKKANYLPINYIYTQKLEKELTIPAFEEIRNSKDFQIFTRSNINNIYSQSYDRFIKYYKSISENELKSCCISDYENYSVVRKTNKNNLLHLDLEKQLITVPDYKSIIIEIKNIDTSKQYVIVFKKDILDSEYISTNIQENQTLNLTTNWEGIYWLYPYDIKSQKLGNYYINIFADNKEFGFSGDEEFNYKIETKIINNKLYIFDIKDNFSSPIAIISKIDDHKYYIKSNLIKIERSDLEETKDGYPINWAKSSDDIPNSPK